MNKKYRLKKTVEWYSFIVISLLAVFVLVYLPMLKTVRYSMYDIAMVGTEERFVGLNNYRILLGQEGFPKAFLNTLVLTALSLLVVPLGYLMACMMNSLRNGKIQGFFRVAFYIPHIITGVAVVMVLQMILKSHDGVFNNFLSLILRRDITIGWLSDPDYAKFGVTIVYIWQHLGYAILINLASLQSIPQEIYEAAHIDGANSFQTNWYITLPNMRPCFVFLGITGIISGMARFSDLYILGGNRAVGAPAGVLQTMMMYIYQYGFEKTEYGMSSAGSVILFAISFVFALLSARMSGLLSKEN